MNPTGKKTFFFLSVWVRSYKETRHQTSASSGTKTQSTHRAEAMQKRRRLHSASAPAQPRKDNKETTIKWYFLFLLRRGCPSLSQGKMMMRTSLQQGHLLSASARARWDNTTIKRSNKSQMKRQQRNNNQMVLIGGPVGKMCFFKWPQFHF